MKPSCLPSGTKVSCKWPGNANRFYGEVRHPVHSQAEMCLIWDGYTEQWVFDEDAGRYAIRVEAGTFHCTELEYSAIMAGINTDFSPRRDRASEWAVIQWNPRQWCRPAGTPVFCSTRMPATIMDSFLHAMDTLCASPYRTSRGPLLEFSWEYERASDTTPEEMLRDIRTALAIPEGVDMLSRVRGLVEFERLVKAAVAHKGV